MRVTGNWIDGELRALIAHLPREKQLAALQKLQTSQVVDLPTIPFTLLFSCL